MKLSPSLRMTGVKTMKMAHLAQWVSFNNCPSCPINIITRKTEANLYIDWNSVFSPEFWPLLWLILLFRCKFWLFTHPVTHKCFSYIKTSSTRENIDNAILRVIYRWNVKRNTFPSSMFLSVFFFFTFTLYSQRSKKNMELWMFHGMCLF